MILVNSSELANTEIDSGRISVLGSVAHKIEDPGEYELVIIQDGNSRSVPMSIQDNFENIDVHVDLSIDLPPTIEAKTNEYIVFYTTQSSGYEVNITKNNGEVNPVIIFDSKELVKGDYFMVRLFADGQYLVKNVLNNTEATMNVNKLEETSIEETDKTEIKCNDNGFDPSLIDTLQSKIQLYEINTKSRIKINRQE